MYIITERPSNGMYYQFSLSDSIDGIIYDDFDVALKQCELISGCGVVKLFQVP